MSLKAAVLSALFAASAAAGCSSAGDPPQPVEKTGTSEEALTKCGHQTCPAGTYGCNCDCGNAECLPIGYLCPNYCTPRK